jgi:hypothetical protein
MTKDEIKSAIRSIGLALNTAHNTTTTDAPNAQISETSWRIDHANELQILKALEQHLMVNSDTDL